MSVFGQLFCAASIFVTLGIPNAAGIATSLTISNITHHVSLSHFAKVETRV